MKICGLLSTPPGQVGGAELSLRILLRRLGTDYRHRTALVGLDHRRHRSRDRGLNVHAVLDLEDARRRLDSLRPDVLVSNQDAAAEGNRLAERLAVPHVLLMHSFEFCPPSDEERRLWGVSRDRVYPGEVDVARAKRADLILACSTFLRERLARHGIEAGVLPPLFELEGRTPPDRARRAGAVAGICGRAYKGAGIFLDLAARMPDTPFLLVGPVAPEYEEAVQARPNIRCLGWGAPDRFLSASRVIVVPSQWPEPYGRIAVEAMAHGIPLLASRTGGLVEAAGHAPELLIDDFRNPAAWEARVRALLLDPAAASANLRAARRAVRSALSGVPLRRFETRLRHLHRTTARRERRPVVALAGGAHQATAFAMINTRWAETLGVRGRVRIDLTPDPPLADLTLHHDFTERFGTAAMPAAGAVAAVRTWDFGPYPKEWVRTIADRYDELWVHTRWIRDMARRAGVPRSRVRVVPLGVDPAVFEPSGPRLRLETSRSVRFLFVGAPVLRKGIDILLRAWRLAFRRDDDVCLVVKSNPEDVFYQGIDWRERIRELAAEKDAAEVLLVDALLDRAALAALYRAAHAAVFPYRAEGFGLPILEAMACGCPPIVPRFGACLDYCDERSALFVPARRIRLPVNRTLAFNTLGFEETVDEVDFCEITPQRLAEALVEAARMAPRMRARVGAAAVRRAGRFTWERSAAAIERAVGELAGRADPPVRLRASRADAAKRAKQLAVARRLFALSR